MFAHRAAMSPRTAASVEKSERNAHHTWCVVLIRAARARLVMMCERSRARRLSVCTEACG